MVENGLGAGEFHRSNLVGLGILPLQYMPGEDRARLGLSGDDPVDLEYLGQGGVLPLVLREVLAKT